jgi:hypothetical protein
VNDPSAQTFTGTLKIQKGTPPTDTSIATTGEQLTATYSGSESDFTWQWKKDNAAIDTGGTGPTYTPTAAGEYAVTIKKAGYNDLTSINTVTVSAAGTPTLSGTITIKKGGAPVDSATVGEALTAEYAPTGTESGVSVSFQWKNDGASVATGANYTPDAAGTYTVTVSATGYNPKTSGAVTVSAAGTPTLPGTIKIQKGGSDVSAANTGEQLTAVYSVSGETGLSWQWKKDGATITTGGTGTTYTPATAGSYTVTVSKSGYQSKESAAVTVSDPSAQNFTGTLTISPNGSVITGTQLTAAYSGSETGFTWQWKKNGANVASSGTTTTYTPSSAGNYTVTISKGGYNSKTSEAVTVTLPDLSGAITIRQGGFDVSAAITGEQLTAVYSGTEDNVSYQWKKNGANVASGGTGQNYTPTTEGIYTVTVSKISYNSKTSAAVTVSDAITPDLSGTITIQQGGSVVSAANGGEQLTAVYSGTEDNVSYQWKKDGANITSGGTGTTYTPATAGSYTVTVSKTGYNSKTSAAVTVTLQNLPGTITIQKDGTVVTESHLYQYLIAVYSVEDEPDLSYQWKKDGVAVTDDHGSNAGHIPQQEGSYTVTVSKIGYNPKTSAAVTITLGEIIEFPGPVVIRKGDPLFEASIAATGELLNADCGPSGISYQWKKDGINVASGGTGATYTPTEAGSYTVTISKYGYHDKTSAPLTVIQGLHFSYTAPSGSDTYTAVGFVRNKHFLVMGSNSATGARPYYSGVSAGAEGSFTAMTNGLSSKSFQATAIVSDPDGNIYVAGGDHVAIKAAATEISTHTDAAWTLTTPPFGGDLNIRAIIYAGRPGWQWPFVVGRTGSLYYWRSNEWLQNEDVAAALTNYQSANGAINGIAYGNETLVVVSSVGTIAHLTTVEGPSIYQSSQWEPSTNNAFPTTVFGTTPINSIAFGGGKFVAVGNDGKIAYSTDNGTTWTRVVNSPFDISSISDTNYYQIRSIAYGNGRFVAVGSRSSGNYPGKIAFSTDGITWMQAPFQTGGTSTFNSVAYGEGTYDNGEVFKRFVVTSNSKYVYYVDME